MSKKDYMKEYRNKNRESICANRREYYAKNRAKILEQKKALYNPDKTKNQRLKREYGISLDEYNELKIKQNNKCACCGGEYPLVVDHCHKNGNVRELLCNRCNTVVGLCEENIDIVMNIMDYIEKWTNKNLKDVQKV
jgi:Recombination endonuclease VII